MAKWFHGRKSGIANETVENQKQMESRLHFQEDRISKLERQNTELKKEVNNLNAEKNELLNRLSRIAGEQITHGNPDIADLSDPNRPTKLAERWSSLYTDEWLDAFEELNKKSRRSETNIPEKQLLAIAVLCYNECRQTAEEQIEKLKATLDDLENYMQDTDCNLGLSQSRRISSAKERYRDPRFADYIINLYKQRRRKDQGWVQAVVKKCANKYISSKNSIHSKRVLSYVNKCAELCWIMSVSDPPLLIEYESFPGQDIDPNKFSLYSGKGTKVDYIVWPVLLLSKSNGLSVLAKGTVQPVNQQDSGHLPKRKSREKIDVTPSVPMHKTANVMLRVPSNTSVRGTTNKSSMKRSTGQDLQNTTTSLSQVKVDVSSTKISRIANPERLNFSSKQQDKLHSSKPLQYSANQQNDFLKTRKGMRPIMQP